MSVILFFIGFVIVGDVVAIGIASIVERYSEPASLLVFLGLFVLVFWVSWLAALRAVERFVPGRS